MITTINGFRKINEKSKIYTYLEIINYITEISDRPGTDIPDFTFDQLRKEKPDFILTELNINDVLKNDIGVAEYVNNSEDRYEDFTEDEYPLHNELYNPIVIWNNNVIDGYNRLSVLRLNNETKLNAYINI